MVRPNSRPSEFPNSYSLNELERHDQKQLRTNAAGPLPRNRFQRLENHSFKESFYPTHFPEYTEVQKDNYPRSRIQNFPHSRSQITPNNIPEIQPITMKSQRSRCRTPEELSNEIKTILQIQGPQDRAKDFQFRGRLMEKQKNGRMEAENPPLQFSNFQKRERPGLPVRPFYKAQYFQGEPKFEYTKHLKCIEMELRRLLGMICHLQTPGYNGRYL
ncbi:hypothetical protein HMI54_002500 [Coelomomyces lativittatus]|nr:hypothetical protein HMI55_000694 [Coelomomyces lativittatus]KAJ1509265.1 hypothetical protein HMI54_002500 [Coelomomyces lativittatus]